MRPARERIPYHLAHLPLTPLTYVQLAARLQLSVATMNVVMPQLLAAKKIEIAGKEGHGTIYRVIVPVPGIPHRDHPLASATGEVR